MKKNILKVFLVLSFCFAISGCSENKIKTVESGIVISIGAIQSHSGGFMSSSYYSCAIKVQLTDSTETYGSVQHVVSVGQTVYREVWIDEKGNKWATSFTPYRPTTD